MSRRPKSLYQNKQSAQYLEDQTPLLLAMDNSSIDQKINSRAMPSLGARLMAFLRGLFQKKPLEARIVRIVRKSASPGQPSMFSSTASSRFSSPFPKNLVRNQKYSVLSFIPLVLFEQFRHFLNLFFLLVCLSQLIPAFCVGFVFTYVFPLSFVLAVTMSKEAYDDFKRYKRDKEANSQRYKRLTTGGLVLVPSGDLAVGDIVYIEKNQRIPADMVFLKTSESSASTFIRTDQLDGETDWKLRVAVPATQKLDTMASIFDMGVSLHIEAPSKDIHSFSGTISISVEKTMEPLGVENTLWMNTVLASGNAFGVVVFTGEHTRAVMNTCKSSTKFGLIDQELNLYSKLLFFISFFMSLLMISMKSFFGPWLVYLVRFFILFSSIIPISLRINVDTARLIYAYYISIDRKSPNIIVRNSSVPEELGRVGYLLSDKTGTLTQNDMELRRLHLGTMFFSPDSFHEVTSHLQHAWSFEEAGGAKAVLDSPSPTFPFLPASSSASSYVKRGRRDLSSRVSDLVQALALCHNVTPTFEEDDGFKISYQASSPDEIAIVKWTASVGVTLCFRDREHVRIRKGISQEVRQYEILEIFPFTSELKRMGIIVKDSVSGELFFYMKGADLVMSSIVQRNDWLEEECDNMAREGLRTLVIGRKKLSEDQLDAFLGAYGRAKLAMQDRHGAMRSVVATMLEADLELLGVTGVEDRLQEDVKITLETLRNAGIKVWMLTGDKVETATCIAISSKLISRNQGVFQVQKLTCRSEAYNVLALMSTSKKDCAFVIDGPSLQLVLDNYPHEFFSSACLLSAVICCRCTPTQKAEIASVLKGYTKKRICCIGDGGNDVSMIQAADVGIGLVGKEGMQASLAADFSMARFCDLSRLLLWHGRNSYKRSAKLSQFVIHRGFVISVLQAVFSSLFYFAPISLYQGLIAVGYATVFTNWAVFSMVLDQDVKEEIALMYPELYKELTKGRSLCFRTFFSWILISLYQGGIIMLAALWLFETDFYHIVAITFTSLLLNELLMVALQINTWHYLMVLAELVSVLIFLISLKTLQHDFDTSFMASPAFIWKVSAITVVSFLPLFVIKSLRRLFNPPNYVKVS